MTFHPSDSCLQALGRDDPCYLSIVTSRGFWISTECCRVLLWSLHTSCFFFFKKSNVSQLCMRFVAFAVCSSYTQPHRVWLCTVFRIQPKTWPSCHGSKVPSESHRGGSSSMCQRRLELGVLARNEDLTCEAPCAGTSQIHSVPSRRPSATLCCGPKTTPAAGILFWVFLVSENMSEINLILYKWLPLVFCNSHKN